LVKKIKANKFHVSKVCEETRLEALMIKIKEEFDRLNIPQEIIEFDNDLADLITKHLMKILIEELERLYGDRARAKKTHVLI